MPEQSTRLAKKRAEYSGASVRVTPLVVTGKPATIVPMNEPQSEALEGALDKGSRPLKGRFAHVPYSSEDLIREKREEAELEDRSS